MKKRWQAQSSIENLRIRAHLVALIRQFFATRDVMEVETPLLGHTSVTDPFIESIPAMIRHPDGNEQQYYLQTSPEYAMKRLLASGSGAIYQITKAFRQGELGRMHQPEFTMIEWYRPGFNHHQLMNEVDELLQLILKTPQAEKITYTTLFQTFLFLDPHTVSEEELIACAKKQSIFVSDNITGKDNWLDILMTTSILPRLNDNHPYFIYDFPESQAALAKIQPGKPPYAARFEVYFRGVELANGFHELQDAKEQRQRFEKNLMDRKALSLSALPIDELFLASLPHLPDCSGVALGIDRLMMLAMQSQDIADVMSFDFARV